MDTQLSVYRAHRGPSPHPRLSGRSRDCSKKADRKDDGHLYDKCPPTYTNPGCRSDDPALLASSVSARPGQHLRYKELVDAIQSSVLQCHAAVRQGTRSLEP